jgi:galactosamine-6-phosphate isomerase
MEVYVASNYEEMSKQAAEEVIRVMQASKNKLLCIASGDTPAGLFGDLVARVNNRELSIADWKFVGLDEWAGMNGGDEGSCRYHLNRQFFQPLHIKEENISFFDGRANDLEKECQQTENFIRKHGGIDVAIVGLGLNGHIGMNEPGTSPSLHSHIADIDAETQKVGQKYFTAPQTLSQGITLGLANIMETRHIILLVSGAHKAGIVKRIIEEEASEQLPASLLRQHPGLKVYLDKEAAQLIQPKIG